jgi:hypothetical protein
VVGRQLRQPHRDVFVPARGIRVGITIRPGLASGTRVENWRSLRVYRVYRAGLDMGLCGLVRRGNEFGEGVVLEQAS